MSSKSDLSSKSLSDAQSNVKQLQLRLGQPWSPSLVHSIIVTPLEQLLLPVVLFSCGVFVLLVLSCDQHLSVHEKEKEMAILKQNLKAQQVGCSVMCHGAESPQDDFTIKEKDLQRQVPRAPSCSPSAPSPCPPSPAPPSRAPCTPPPSSTCRPGMRVEQIKFLQEETERLNKEGSSKLQVLPPPFLPYHSLRHIPPVLVPLVPSHLQQETRSRLRKGGRRVLSDIKNLRVAMDAAKQGTVSAERRRPISDAYNRTRSSRSCSPS
eukprot:763799-Hanusia_phi.AAC.1